VKTFSNELLKSPSGMRNGIWRGYRHPIETSQPGLALDELAELER
jgi:hypothetical protein